MHVSTNDQIKYIKQIKFSFGFVQRTADVVKIMRYPSFVGKRFLFIQLSAQKKSWRQEAKLVNVSSHVSHDTKQLMALSSFDHGVSAFNSVLRLALGRPEGHIRMTEMSFNGYQLKKNAWCQEVTMVGFENDAL